MKEDFASKVNAGGVEYKIFDIKKLADKYNINVTTLPYSMRVLLENLVRNYDGVNVTEEDFKAIADWQKTKKSDKEIAFLPARVLMQDFTGVPAVVDLAAMRDTIKKFGGDPEKINPLSPVHLVIDHSVQVNSYGQGSSLEKNVEDEFRNNQERYVFLKWGQSALNNFKAVPPGTGICHQVNLEYIANVIWTSNGVAYPDSLVGTDSHTTMVNGLSVLGWGVGGIEAEAAMLGQPITMLIPEVIGFKLIGKLKEGVTATDLVLTVTQMLRKKGVVNKFVEFYGPGLDNLSLADRATIANMAPEYGATCGFFPIDNETLEYLKLSGRPDNVIKLVEEYAKANGFFRNDSDKLEFTDSLDLDISSVEPSLAGPKRPQDKIILSKVKDSIHALASEYSKDKTTIAFTRDKSVSGRDYQMANADVVIAAITSCTNTSNPSVMIAAGLVARNAKKFGLKSKPWVKTSLAPGSQVVTEYLQKANLIEDFNSLGFNIVGYGCTTCIGNSGPLLPEIEEAISKNDMLVSAVLSGNRNFEGRVHPLVKANYLASPPLVVAYAIAGTTDIDLAKDPIGKSSDGKDVFLKDIWPSNKDIEDIMNHSINADMFKAKYGEVFKGDKNWQNIKVVQSMNYNWDQTSTYIANPPYFEGMTKELTKPKNIENARVLAVFGDSITTDHISPAGNIAKSSPAAAYLKSRGVEPKDFNSYGARRGHHEVMMRGTFANIRIKNEMLGGKEGGNTIYAGSGEEMSIYDAAMKYKSDNTPLVIFAGKEYGTGSSRDWAAKGTFLLGVKAVISESFERIHRSNLVGMGVLPLVFKDSQTRQSLGIKGDEKITLLGIDSEITPRMDIKMIIERKDGTKLETTLLCRIDTKTEVEYYLNGGIMQYMIRRMLY